jgi:hypothetical protein
MSKLSQGKAKHDSRPNTGAYLQNNALPQFYTIAGCRFTGFCRRGEACHEGCETRPNICKYTDCRWVYRLSLWSVDVLQLAFLPVGATEFEMGSPVGLGFSNLWRCAAVICFFAPT